MIKMQVDCDLGSDAARVALEELRSQPGGLANIVLIASDAQAFWAGRLAEKYAVKVVILPDEMLSSSENWGLSEYGPDGLWTSGA